MKARYVAEQEDIAVRYERWEIIGLPEIRKRRGEWHSFNPYAYSPPHDPKDPPKEPVDDPSPWEPTPKEQPPEETTNLYSLERVLVLLFLRRHVTWCARARKYAQLEGAALLQRQINGERR